MIEPDEYDTILRPDPVGSPLRPTAPDSVPDAEDTVIRRPAPAAFDGGADADGEAGEAGEEEHLDDDAEDAEDEREPVEALRFRISTGSAQLVLDEDVHIGRNPRPPRLDRGRTVRLLRVESPSGVVSSSHLGLRRMGSTAVAADLMSTNGTVVFLPGFPPRRLRQGESVVAPPGTRLEIGEGIVIEVIKPSALS